MTHVKKLREIKFIGDTPYIDFGNAYQLQDSPFQGATVMGKRYTGTANGYIFRNREDATAIASKIADMELAISVAKEKAARESGISADNSEYRYFNVPKIVPTLSEDSEEFTVPSAWDGKPCTFESGFVVDVQLSGSADAIKCFKVKSIYASSYNQRYWYEAAAKELGVEVVDFRVPESDYAAVCAKAAELRNA